MARSSASLYKKAASKARFALQAETQVQRDDQFEARPTSGTEPNEPKFQRNRTKSGLMWRYHVYRDRRRLAVPRWTETDLFNGELVGYAMSERMTKHLVMQALFCALASQRSAPGLIHHTDRGSQQYCAQAYRELVGQFGMKASMSRRGNCFDNAPME
jgi:transposase InsO family protein